VTTFPEFGTERYQTSFAHCIVPLLYCISRMEKHVKTAMFTKNSKFCKQKLNLTFNVELLLHTATISDMCFPKKEIGKPQPQISAKYLQNRIIIILSEIINFCR
jgi:hypothetical protein